MGVLGPSAGADRGQEQLGQQRRGVWGVAGGPSLAHLQLLVAHLPQLGSMPGLSWLVAR